MSMSSGEVFFHPLNVSPDDYWENLSLGVMDNEPTLEEHAFIPGDGEMTHMDVCQFTGCGAFLAEHEEGEPCCFPFMSTRGQQHAYDCPDDIPKHVRPATFAQPAAYNVHEDDAAADAYERHLGL